MMIECCQIIPHPDECLLGDVVGILFTSQQAKGKAIGIRLCQFDKLAKGVGISFFALNHQLLADWRHKDLHFEVPGPDEGSRMEHGFNG